jgi:uncharacterized membrane protein HdeD (DUF308 family)
MVAIEPLVRFTLTLARLVLFGLALVMTVISFQSYRENKTEKLQFAFIGFAFISMGVAISTVIVQVGEETSEIWQLSFQIVETIPFIVGFSMLYLSLYR